MIPERSTEPRLKLHWLAIPLMLASSAACSESAQPGAAPLVPQAKASAAAADLPQGTPVSGLPFSQGRSFTSLDQYLAFLETRGAYDIPWYRKVRPGVYELVSRRRPASGPQVFTREELARKFGFPG